MVSTEVRERSCQLKTILDAVQDAEDEAGSGMALIEELANVFAEEIQPSQLSSANSMPRGSQCQCTIVYRGSLARIAT